RARGVAGRRVQRVVRAGRGERVPTVRMTGVVEHLHLRSALPGLAGVRRDAEQDAAVAPFGESPFEAELEVAELLRGQQVAAVTVAHELAAFGLPAGRRRGIVEAAPAVER